MKQRHALMLLGVALVVAGCSTSKGPRFNPYLTGDKIPLPGGYTSNIFQIIESTNRVDNSLLEPPLDFFRLGPGDVIEIEILNDPASVAEVFVGPDGKIYYSLLPGTFVWGLTLAEAKALIESSLAKYIRGQPEILLTLRGVSSRRIWILGNVEQPGIHTLATPTTLLEAISMAGGMLKLGNTATRLSTARDLADLDNSFIMRDGKHLTVDMDALFRKGDLTQNVYLQPGDYVYIRPAVSKDIYVMGAVFNPGILPYKREVSLVAAMASVGGAVPYAYLTHVAIIRGSLNEPRIAVLNYKNVLKGKEPNVELMPGDIVYVPYSPYRRIYQFADQILNEFVRTLAINEGINAVDEDGAPVGVSVGVGVGP